MSGAGRSFSTWNHSSTVPGGRQPEPRDRASARDRSPGHPRGTCNTDAVHRVRPAARTAGPRTHDRSSRAVAPSTIAIRMSAGSRRRELGAALAAAFLAGAWTETAMVRRGGEALSPRPRWLRPVVRRVLEAYPRPPADRPRELASYIELTLKRYGGTAARRALARLRAADGPDAVADAADRDAGRARRPPGARRRRAHVARGRPRARARHAPPPPAQLHLPLAAAPGRAAAADRAAETAAEGDPALDPPRDPRPHPAARRRPRLRSRPLRPHPCGAARRPGDRRAARPRGLLRERPAAASSASSAPPGTPRPSRTR